ncbi:MAG TPA: inositol monophosphatase family protein [Gaiellales bacterium]|nr:inositol monophosphatase family protein [Gaiellales bacterium]
MPSADLALALELADLADSTSLPRFGAHDLRVIEKADSSPVTDADHAVEQALRSRLAAERPRDGVLGEEHGATEGGARWVLDPIDGTRNFARGIPVWATLIALEREGVAVCGVVSAPALGHRWWAERGGGAFCDGERIVVSNTAELSDAAVSCAHGSDLAALEPLVWHARGFGDFWQHMLVAAGGLDAAVDAALSHWDVAAVAPIVEEAGGRVSGPRGEPAAAGRQLVSSNGRVHDQLLASLAGS